MKATAKLVHIDGNMEIVEARGEKFTLRDVKNCVTGDPEVLFDMGNTLVIGDIDEQFYDCAINQEASIMTNAHLYGDILFLQKDLYEEPKTIVTKKEHP